MSTEDEIRQRDQEVIARIGTPERDPLLRAEMDRRWLLGEMDRREERLAEVEAAHGSLILDMADLRDAISALLPDECWVSRTVGINCTDFIGGKLGNAEFTEEMCCLPCRIRIELNKVSET